MPEYLAPGVFVEEVSYRAKSIEGVSTTTTGFVGPTRFGPTDVEPELLTSLVEFERTYGDGEQLAFAGGTPQHNYVWHAARAFFENGGKRLYVQRVFEPLDTDKNGCAAWTSTDNALTISSRFPGRAGERRVQITAVPGADALVRVPDPASASGGLKLAVRGLTERDVVWYRKGEAANAAGGQQGAGNFYQAYSTLDDTGRVQWELKGPPDKTIAAEAADAQAVESEAAATEAEEAAAADPQDAALAKQATAAREKATTDRAKATTAAEEASVKLDDALGTATDPERPHVLRTVTVTVSVLPQDDGPAQVWSALALDARHTFYGAPDGLQARFAEQPDTPAARRTLPIVITATAPTGAALLGALAEAKGAQTGATEPEKEAARDTFLSKVADRDSDPAARTLEVVLRDGDDGKRPTAGFYEGESDDPDAKPGLLAFEDLEDISIVAAPGATQDFEASGWHDQAVTINDNLIRHAQKMRYRIAVIDSGDEQGLQDVKAMRDATDSKHAALYYPWIRVLDPVTKQQITLPPSGFIAGIYARNDIERAVYKAPANEVISLALGFERTINKAEQEALNPKGINCLRSFEGRGSRVWGARTISSDPEWKYVNLRRYFAYLERSIDVGTQWAVFEPNGPALWANVRRTISDFLFNEFSMGAFLGDKPETSYFVRCDRSTMTQNQIDNGQLVCLVGVAVVKPAEFVIFRVGQWTADAKR